MLAKLGRLEEALAAADRAIERKSEFAGGHLARGRVLEAMGRGAEAQASLAKAAELETKAGEPATA